MSTTKELSLNLESSIRLTKTDRCPGCLRVGDHRKLFPLDGFSVYECTCKTRFIDPSLDAESMMKIYQSSETLRLINPALEHYYEYETLNPSSLTYRDYNHALDRALQQSPGNRLLEVGSGTGGFLKFARSKGWEVFGVDSSPENVEKMNASGIAGAASDYLALDIPEKFDCIVLWDLIEHPQDPGAFLKKSADLLNPGGTLLLATPNYPNFLSLTAEWLYKLSFGKVQGPVSKMYMLEHTSYFGKKTLEALLNRNGFKIAEAWKTETDLKRYYFKPIVHWVLRTAFLFGRLFGLQNRLIAIAKRS